jgi:putative ABC transport system substrate-binding protein
MSSRREFITLLGGAAAVWPLAARAQQAGKLPTIGFLGASTPSAWGPWTAAFVQRLRELGWIEGRTVAIEYRWAEGRSERYADIAAEFVQLKVDVIVTVGSAVAATKQVTSTIPIVFAIAVDPLGSGMVDSLARPGGNATGLSVQSTELAGKRLEILREALPNLQRLAIIGDVGYASSVLEMSEVQAAARKVRHAGDFVDKILKGTKPADIPVQQPTKFELVVNLTAAKALRVTIPETFLARADEVIE